MNYTPEQWNVLGTSVMNPSRIIANSFTSTLSIIDRIWLVSDYFAAGKAGYYNITDAYIMM